MKLRQKHSSLKKELFEWEKISGFLKTANTNWQNVLIAKSGGTQVPVSIESILYSTGKAYASLTTLTERGFLLLTKTPAPSN